MGLLGPFIGSVAQLTISFTTVGEFFQQGDVIGAINELINIPANMTNAFLNGYGNFDLTPIAAGLLPPEITKIGLNLGGWISPPVPTNGSLIAPLVTPTEFSGGTLFSAVSVTADANLRTGGRSGDAGPSDQLEGSRNRPRPVARPSDAGDPAASGGGRRPGRSCGRGSPGRGGDPGSAVVDDPARSSTSRRRRKRLRRGRFRLPLRGIMPRRPTTMATAAATAAAIKVPAD